LVMENAMSAARRNWLLAALSPEDLSLLAPHLKVIPMELGGLLQQEGELIEAVYFPLDGMVSLLAIMADGDGIETVTVGREGAVGAGAGFGNLAHRDFPIPEGRQPE
jgi:CRP-like cAMP-binding protein